MQEKLCLFGHVSEGDMILNSSGLAIQFWIHELENKFKNVIIHENIIMPNHVHLIIEFTSENQSLSTTLQWFKTMTTNRYINGVKNENWQPFNKKLWQRSFFDHIIRNSKAYQNIADYIIENPSKWIDDELYME